MGKADGDRTENNHHSSLRLPFLFLRWQSCEKFGKNAHKHLGDLLLCVAPKYMEGVLDFPPS
jgi:hypothetical protein